MNKYQKSVQRKKDQVVKHAMIKHKKNPYAGMVKTTKNKTKKPFTIRSK